MEFPSLNQYLTPPYPPFIVPMPRGIPLTDKDGKPTFPNGSTPPTIPYGVPYFPPPGAQGGPPANSAAALFAGHPYPLIGNYLPPQYHRFYQDAHFLYFPDMKLQTKFPMKFTGEPIGLMPRENRLLGEKKPKKKPREPKEEKEPKKEKGKKRKKLAPINSSYCICERPEDGKFMVGCDVCDNWFHPKCVNISKRVAKTLDYFLCPHCKDFVPEEDRQALEQQQTHTVKKKKIKKEERTEDGSAKEEDVFDSLEQLSKAALSVLETSDKEDKIESKQEPKEKKERVQEKPSPGTIRPQSVTFQTIPLNVAARIEMTKENIFALKESQELLEHIMTSTPWEQEQIQMYGTTYSEPRLTAWFGDTNCNYSTHGISRNVLPWTKDLLKIKSRVEEICEFTFNNILLNYYRNGDDYMGFHDEQNVQASKGKIAYLSLGNDRNFIIKHRNNDEVHTLKIFNGSLLVMHGEDTAKNYIYSVPKARSSCGPRVNLILRNVEKTQTISQPVESKVTTA